jgi:uncharacterized protein YbaR (Trm112 family)
MELAEHSVSEELLFLLACPACEEHPPLQWQAERLVCKNCKRTFPIRDGIPVMILEDSPELSE